MTQTVPPNNDVDLRLNGDSVHNPTSELMDVCSSKLAERIISYVNPSSVLLFHSEGVSSSSALFQLGRCFLEEGVKVTVCKDPSLFRSIDGAHDLAIFVSSSTKDFSASVAYFRKTIAAHCSTSLFVHQLPASIERVDYGVADLMASVAGFFLDRGYIKDIGFASPLLGFSMSLYTAAEKGDFPSAMRKSLMNAEREYISLSLERDRRRGADITRAVQEGELFVATPEDNELVASLAARDQTIASLREKLVVMTQKMYVAQDAVLGAEAEKATAAAEVTELHYQMQVRNKEIHKLIEAVNTLEYDIEEEEAKNLTSSAGLVKRFLYQYRVVRFVARLTSPIRKQMRES